MQLTTKGFLANESITDTFLTSHIAEEGQTGRDGTSKHLGASERHSPSSPASLTKVAGHNTVQIMSENISLQSCSSDNLQKPAVNKFWFNRPDNNNSTQAIAHI